MLFRTSSAFSGIVLLLALPAELLLASGLAVSQTRSNMADPLRREARVAISRGEFHNALEAYHKAAELAPRDAGLWVEIAAVLKTMKRFPEAIAAFEAALQIDRRSESAELGLADTYRLVFNYDLARRLMERSRREHPKSAAPLIALGELDIQFQKYDDAVSHLQQALRVAPTNVAARNDLAVAYEAKGDLPRALQQLDAALERDPRNALAHYLRGTIYADRNENGRALVESEKVFEAEPQNARGRLLLGKVAVRLGQCRRAAEVLRPLAEGPQADSEALFLLWQAYHCAREDSLAQQAMEHFTEASKREHAANEGKAQADHLVKQAGELARSNQFAPAVNLLQQALEKDPENGNAHSQLAKIYYSQGEIEKARDAVNRALQINPFHPDYLYVKGRVLEKEGKLDEALQAFKQVVLVNPNEADAYFEMGAIYRKRNERVRALGAFKKAVELSPDDPDYRRALNAASAP